MGCCISKRRPDKDSQLEDRFNHDEDKLVISQAPPTPIPYFSNKISPSPPSPTSSSTSSISSFTCTTSDTTCSTSSLSSASSALSSKHRSFSNDFLWSCYKENPHIIHINSLGEASLPLVLTNKSKAQSRKIINPSPPSLTPPLMKQSPTQKVAGSFSMPQKRVRSNSPTNLTRQKSFRKEPAVRPNSASIVPPSRTLGSPSPSRRFNGDKCGSGSALATTNTITENGLSKRMIGQKVNADQCHSVSSSTMRKESLKPASPNNSSRGLRYSGLRHRETCTNSYRVGSKIDETIVKDVLSNHDMDSALTEDIDNPLISLDCFIFL